VRSTRFAGGLKASNSRRYGGIRISPLLLLGGAGRRLAGRRPFRVFGGLRRWRPGRSRTAWRGHPVPDGQRKGRTDPESAAARREFSAFEPPAVRVLRTLSSEHSACESCWRPQSGKLPRQARFGHAFSLDGRGPANTCPQLRPPSTESVRFPVRSPAFARVGQFGRPCGFRSCGEGGGFAARLSNPPEGGTPNEDLRIDVLSLRALTNAVESLIISGIGVSVGIS
jgi:hypothetical protein